MEDVAQRTVVAALTLSAAALVGISVDEGFTARAVPDAVRGMAVPTVGFGSTQGVRPGDSTTPVAALQRQLREVQQFEGALKTCVRVPLHQYEYDAYINLAYNIGAPAFCNSTLVRRLNAGDYAGACRAILMWRRAAGVDCSHPNDVCTGLWKRRMRTYQQCLGQEPQP